MDEDDGCEKYQPMPLVPRKKEVKVQKCRIRDLALYVGGVVESRRWRERFLVLHQRGSCCGCGSKFPFSARPGTCATFSHYTPATRIHHDSSGCGGPAVYAHSFSLPETTENP